MEAYGDEVKNLVERGIIMFEFTVYMEPKGKERPRFGRNGRVFTPRTTTEAEKQIAEAFRVSGGCEMSEYIKLDVIAFCKIPEKTSRVQRQEMLSGVIRPAKVPDADNILKLVCDALQGPGLLCADDKLITSVSCTKLYSDVPKLVIRISEDMTNEVIA